MSERIYKLYYGRGKGACIRIDNYEYLVEGYSDERVMPLMITRFSEGIELVENKGDSLRTQLPTGESVNFHMRRTKKGHKHIECTMPERAYIRGYNNKPPQLHSLTF